VLPSDREERERILFAAVSAGYDLPDFPQYYVPYADRSAEVIARAKPLEELKKKRVEAPPKLAALEREFPEGTRDLGFLRVRARKKDLTAIIDRKSGEVLKVLSIDPWV